MKGFVWFLAVCATVAFIIAIVISIGRWYSFHYDIRDYLKLAGDAPTVEKANEFLETALTNMERKGLTGGNSAFFFHKPNADVGIWYNQIKGVKGTTANLLERDSENPGSVSQLERDNALMKIRKVVLDDAQKGVKVTTPPNITWFPYQWDILMLWILSTLFALIGWVLVKPLQSPYRF